MHRRLCWLPILLVSPRCILAQLLILDGISHLAICSTPALLLKGSRAFQTFLVLWPAFFVSRILCIEGQLHSYRRSSARISCSSHFIPRSVFAPVPCLLPFLCRNKGTLGTTLFCQIHVELLGDNPFGLPPVVPVQ